MLGACAVIEGGAGEDATKVVSERTQQRWDLVAAGQLEQAYEYFSPASRTTLTLEAFRKRAGGKRWWRSMRIEKVDCRLDTCQVTMVLDYDLYEIKGLTRLVEETWIKDAGTWWLVAGK
ncbi:MAG: hypothetical protein NDI88_09835 [Lysobacter sp.]|nr:hypothetical protein [Lysobacter sp.]